MLNFLRKLRRKEMKTGRYLKYAIGEIILVVVGILIALQVSNLNENLKKNKERDAFKASLKIELLADRKYLTTAIEELKKQSNELAKFKEKIRLAGSDFSQIKHIVQNDFQPFLSDLKGFNNNTYNTHLSAGKLNLFSTELQQALYFLNSLQLKAMEGHQKYTDLYFGQIESFGAKFPLDISIALVDKGELYDKIWAKAQLEDLANALNAWGTSKRNYYRVVGPTVGNVLEQTELIISKYFAQNKNDQLP